MQHPIEHTCNICLKKQMKHLKQTLATYVYNHCNICNISIYLCNIHMKHMQHTSETSETLKTYACNICFQRNISLLLRRMKACLHVEFTGGNDTGVSCRRRAAAGGDCATRREGRSRMTRRGQPSAVARRQLRVAPGRASSRELCLRGAGGGGNTETKRRSERLLVWICVEKPKRHTHI
jgi:hypothetical protein